MKRSILLILFVLLIAGQTAQSQTEEFNNQQMIESVYNYLCSGIVNHNFIENDNDEFVVFSGVDCLPDSNGTNPSGILLSYYDNQSLLLNDYQRYNMPNLVTLAIEPYDFIMDGDDYIGCGGLIHIVPSMESIVSGFVFRLSSNGPEFVEVMSPDSNMMLRTIERLNDDTLVACGSDMENGTPLVVLLDNDLDEYSRYEVSSSGGYQDHVLNDDGDLVIVGHYYSNGDEGMQISVFNGSMFINISYLNTSIDLYPTAIAYDGENYYVTGHGSESYHALLIKLRSNLSVVWAKKYEFSIDDTVKNVRFHDLTVERDDEVVISGTLADSTYFAIDGFIFKTDTAGTPQYNRHIGSSDEAEALRKVDISSDGSIVSIGQHDDEEPKIYFVKSDTSGDVNCDWGEADVDDTTFALTVNDLEGDWIDDEATIDHDIYTLSDTLVQEEICDTYIKVNYNDEIELQNGLLLAPNPAESSVDISFEIGEEAQVSLAVYDMTGRKVIEVFGGEALGPGPHAETVDLKGLPSGIYNVVLEYGGKRLTNKLSIIK